MSRLRVLHLTSSFPRHEADTVAPFLLDLARVEAGAGMDVHVLAPHDAGLPRREDWDGIGIARYRYAPPAWEGLAYRGGLLGAASKPARAPLVPALLAAFLAAATAEARRLRPDVLHAHWWLPAGLAGAGARVATGTPLVVTLHGTDVHLAARPGWRLPARAVAVRATALVAASEALAGEAALVLGLPPGRVGVARMPVSAAAHGIGATPLPPWPPLRLVAVGRLVPEKGLDVLLGAVRRLVAAGQDVRLEVVGGGPEEGRLRALGAWLGDRVTWAGAVPPAELGPHLRAAHALVVPSRREGLGLVALEALAHGRPVVGSRVGGLPEAVDDGTDGLLVPAGDEKALVVALGRLPLPAPAGAALAYHRPDVVAAEHLELYHRAMAGARVGHPRRRPATNPCPPAG